MLGPLLAPMAFFAATSLVCLDDGYTYGQGGTVELVKGSHPSIRMESEIVRIDHFPLARVRAKFVFKNHGKATDVLIGFPGEAEGDASSDSARLDNFKSFVDGKPVAVKVQPASGQGMQQYKLWYTKKVHFDAGQTHVIEDSYEGGGSGDTSGFRNFDYVLATGGSWHGTIGKATVIMDISGLSGYSPVKIGPEGAKVVGSVATWTWTNYKPRKGDGVGVVYFPSFRGIFLNGHLIGRPQNSIDKPISKPNDLIGLMGLGSPYGEPSYCVLRDHSVRIAATLAATWLGASTRTLRDNRFRVVLGDRWAEFKVGSRTVQCSDGRMVPMEFPVETVARKDDVTDAPKTFQVIGFQALVKALGGKANLDTTKRRLDIWIK